ncbi:serine/threonine-protein phosphatase BSL3-like protein [Tanacetum coccineum]
MTVEGLQSNARGPGLVTFGPDRVMEFCNNNNLQLIVRANECVMDGFERFAQGHLITLFSATNYCGTANNAGAILVLGRDLVVVPKLIHPLPLAISSPETSPERHIEYTWMQKYGKIDVIVSNAAANPSIDAILDSQESALDKLWKINRKTAILLLQDASPHLTKGSSIVFISSLSAFQPPSSIAMYGVTKTALLGLTKLMTLICCRYGSSPCGCAAGDGSSLCGRAVGDGSSPCGRADGIGRLSSPCGRAARDGSSVLTM